MKLLAPLLLLAYFGPDASAALIPYYQMDSLAFLATDIVLCEEIKYEKKLGSAGRDIYEAKFEVVQTMKGTIKPKVQLTVEIGLSYTRRLMGGTRMDSQKQTAIPMGRALLFLKKEEEIWQPVTGGVKLIIKAETYCYGQFLENPGPLWLARMAPENIEVDSKVRYGEELLLKDLKVALEKAKKLTEATAGFAEWSLIRKEPERK